MPLKVADTASSGPAASRAGHRAGALIVAWIGAALFAAALLYFAYFFLVELSRPVMVPPESVAGHALINVALFSAFALHHSIAARLGVKARLARVVPRYLERSLYVWIASLLFLAVCLLWQPLPGAAWHVTGLGRWMLHAVQLAGLVLTLRSAARLDVLDLAGVRQAADGAEKLATDDADSSAADDADHSAADDADHSAADDADYADRVFGKAETRVPRTEPVHDSGSGNRQPRGSAVASAEPLPATPLTPTSSGLSVPSAALSSASSVSSAAELPVSCASSAAELPASSAAALSARSAALTSAPSAAELSAPSAAELSAPSAALPSVSASSAAALSASSAASSAAAAALEIRGPYRWVRHPIYLGWVLMVFGAPAITTGRLLFASVSTLYLIVAIPFEERSLAAEFGAAYKDYQRRVRWRLVRGIW
jgi:protein-S-isoprenylcysteine O-methyltransferase Ste14